MAKFLSIALSFLVIFVQVNPASAVSPPSASWVSPAQSSVVTKDFDLVAQASVGYGSSAHVSKWCFAVSGDASATLPEYADRYVTTGGGNYWLDTEIGPDGCFSAYPVTKVSLRFDASEWKSGLYTFTARAFDSAGSASATITRTLQVRTTPPSASWVSPSSGSLVSGEFSLIVKAGVASGSSASILKWCFSVSGQDEVNLPTSISHSSSIGEIVSWDTQALQPDGCFMRAYANQVRLDFDSSEWSSGPYTFSASVSDSDGLESQIIERTLQSGNGAPTVVWNSNLDGNSIWRSGYWAPVGGKLLRGGGPLPKTVSLRAWQHRRGWTSWKSVKVSSTGKYSTSFYAESNLKIQMKVPSVSGHPGTSDTVNVPIYGTVSITGPSKANAQSTFYYKLKVSPKWLSSITCNLTITRYDAWGYQIGTWYYQPKIKLSNGYGTLRQNLYYKNSRSSMNCDAGNSVLTESTGSSDFISTNIR